MLLGSLFMSPLVHGSAHDCTRVARRLSSILAMDDGGRLVSFLLSTLTLVFILKGHLTLILTSVLS